MELGSYGFNGGKWDTTVANDKEWHLISRDKIVMELYWGLELKQQSEESILQRFQS